MLGKDNRGESNSFGSFACRRNIPKSSHKKKYIFFLYLMILFPFGERGKKVFSRPNVPRLKMSKYWVCRTYPEGMCKIIHAMTRVKVEGENG